MRRTITRQVPVVAALSAFLLLCFAAAVHAQATIIIVNNDGPGEGFNDPTPFTPVGGNNATTLGQARLNVFQYAADIWGRCINSNVTIQVRANFDPQACDPGGGVLGSANTTAYFRDFTGAPVASTWYHAALANALNGSDLDPSSPELRATFNSDIDNNDDCLFGTNWYYGLDGNPPANGIDLVTTVLHEICHGLGFVTPVDLTNGQKLSGFDDTYSLNLEDHGLGLWPALTDAQRQASAVDDPDLHWIGGNVLAAAPLIPLTAGFPSGHVQMHAPEALNLGSSVNHFSVALFPHELMEPSYTGPDHTIGLALPLMQDIGWTIDTTAPVITCPDDLTVECTGLGGALDSDALIAAFLSGASATDNTDPDPVITHDAPSFFSVGTTTTVTFTATDVCGNTSSCQATVTVVDTTPPEITCPENIQVQCTSSCGVDAGEILGFVASASDICGSVVITDDRPTCFPLGTTTVTFTAVDEAGISASCSALVTVVDTIPPDLVVEVDPEELWPPNHKLADVCATVSATDICDPNPEISLVSITSDEPDNEQGVGDGNTTQDVQIVDASTHVSSGTDKFWLRSERQGRGVGRKYTLVYEAVDASGNTTVVEACVIVPHDQRGGAASSIGFTADGLGFEAGSDEFVLVIPGWTHAGRPDPARAHVGNLRGSIGPNSYRWSDIDDDGRRALVLRYDVAGALRLREADPAGSGDGAISAGSRAKEKLAFRYVDENGEGYLVGDILALGPPIALGPEDGNDDELPEIIRVPGAGGDATVAPGAVVEVYTVLGQRVRTFVLNGPPGDTGVLGWDGRDATGRLLPNGMYFYRIRSADQVRVKKVMLAR